MATSSTAPLSLCYHDWHDKHMWMIPANHATACMLYCSLTYVPANIALNLNNKLSRAGLADFLCMRAAQWPAGHRICCMHIMYSQASNELIAYKGDKGQAQI